MGEGGLRVRGGGYARGHPLLCIPFSVCSGAGGDYGGDLTGEVFEACAVREGYDATF